MTEKEVLESIVDKGGWCRGINCDDCPFNPGNRCLNWNDVEQFEQAEEMLKEKYSASSKPSPEGE